MNVLLEERVRYQESKSVKAERKEESSVAALGKDEDFELLKQS